MSGVDQADTYLEFVNISSLRYKPGKVVTMIIIIHGYGASVFFQMTVDMFKWSERCDVSCLLFFVSYFHRFVLS